MDRRICQKFFREFELSISGNRHFPWRSQIKGRPNSRWILPFNGPLSQDRARRIENAAQLAERIPGPARGEASRFINGFNGLVG